MAAVASPSPSAASPRNRRQVATSYGWPHSRQPATAGTQSAVVSPPRLRAACAWASAHHAAPRGPGCLSGAIVVMIRPTRAADSATAAGSWRSTSDDSARSAVVTARGTPRSTPARGPAPRRPRAPRGIWARSPSAAERAASWARTSAWGDRSDHGSGPDVSLDQPGGPPRRGQLSSRQSCTLMMWVRRMSFTRTTGSSSSSSGTTPRAAVATSSASSHRPVAM